jgi:subtilase family serine protease
MRTRILTTLAGAFAIVLAMTGGSAGPAHAQTAAPAASAKVYTKPVCGAAAGHGRDECLALVRTSAAGVPLDSSSGPGGGLSPAQLQSAYQLASAAAQDGTGMTVALVDAYDDPGAAADLAAYRAQYGLPPCTEASGCFRKVNQEGQAAPLPSADADWGLEESLDIDMVSAICPQCHIILAEADDNQDYNLAATVATAAHLGATQISNSYGESEYPGEAALEPFYDQPGVEVTAGSGDSGYGVSYPAASAYVTSVGGTSLWQSGSGRGWTESVWSGSGSGCSAVIAKPAWQHDSCANRTDNDVAAVAAPSTPVAVYDTYGAGGWTLLGGTSVSSPIIASVDALLGGQAAKSPGGSYWYTHPHNVFSVSTGANGTCDPAYLCTAQQGYNGPTGNGTPDFTGATQSGNSCYGGFSAVTTPPVSGAVPDATSYSYDTDIAALSPDNVWTTGYDDATNAGLPGADAGYAATLNHWDGSRWTTTTPPMFVDGSGVQSSAFSSISFDNPADGWAAGYLTASGKGWRPMVSHWNGHAWASTPVLSPLRMSDINGTVSVDSVSQSYPPEIKALSPDDVWLTGNLQSQVPSGNPDGSFMEHWNGSAWQMVSFPGQDGTKVSAISGTGANDLWVVGQTLSDSAGVALHWDGSTWTSVAIQQPTDGIVSLNGVSASSPDSVWAVGIDNVGGNVPVTEHWDGHSWTIVTIPGSDSVASGNTYLTSVDAISSSDVWAVGWWWKPGATVLGFADLVIHWDGQTWTIVPGVNTSDEAGLDAVSGSSPGNVWLAGEHEQIINTVTNIFTPSLFSYGCDTQAATAGTPAAASTAATTTTAATTAAAARSTPAGAPDAGYQQACDTPAKAGVAECMALIDTRVAQRAQATLHPDAAPTGVGYGPSDLQNAYALPSATAGSGETVAIVDAYDDPNAEADLATYRSDWGLPPCTAASGCFTKVNQDGNATPLPQASGSSGWATEESLDLDMVSAICPNCHILLVEANSPDTSDLGAGVNAAVQLGAKFVSNSYGATEYSGEQSDDAAYYNHPGVAVTASGGDDGYGYGVQFPAASPNVVSVGGTSLTPASGSRGWTETAWNGTGSGCSAMEPKPGWQTDSDCTNRTDDDVSADADPYTGVAVYDTYDRQGWLQVGGTSVGAPLIASTFALAGTPEPNTSPASYIYAHTSSLNDVTSGSDGSCSPAYLCTAGPGYDGPTGWGTPYGIAAFTAQTGNIITVTNPGNQTATGGVAFSLQVQAADSGSGQTLTYQASALPPGLSLDATSGLISGTPSQAGSFSSTITVTDGTGASGTAVILFNVVSPVSFSGLIPQGSYTGQPVLLPTTAADTQPGQTLRYSATGLPPDLSISADTGTISGKITGAGYYQPVITATDNTGWSDSVPVVWYAAALSASGRTGPLRLDGKCLTAPGLGVASCDGTAAQQWQLRPDGTIAGSGQCLAVTGASVALAGCDSGSDAQQWRTGSSGELIAAASGKCLTGGQSVASCTASASQRWSAPAGPLVSAVTGMCAAAAGNHVELAFCDNTTAQAWLVGGDGTLVVGGSCLTVSAGKVTLARCASTAAQTWQIAGAGTLVNPASGKCLSDPGADPSDGTVLTTGSCEVSTAGLWSAD